MDEFDAALLAGIGSTTIGMTVTAPQGRFLWANPAFMASSGYSMPELASMTVYDITHPDDVSRVRAQAERLFAHVASDGAPDTRANLAIEARYITRSGTWMWACVNMTAIRDAAGDPPRVVSTVEDITPRVRSLRDSRRVEHVSAALAGAITPDDVATVIVVPAVAPAAY